jgi:hypothetical protein
MSAAICGETSEARISLRSSGLRSLTLLRAEVDEMKAALARRLEQAKYSPSQPRVPPGNPRANEIGAELAQRRLAGEA